MACKRELNPRREDSDPRMTSCFWWQDEDRLGEVHLAGELSHRLVVDITPVREDGELVPGERNVGEDVRDDVTQSGHRPILYHDRVSLRP